MASRRGGVLRPGVNLNGITNSLDALCEKLQELIDRPQITTEKTGWYCPEGEDATWLCDLIIFENGVEIERITEDSGIPCKEDPPRDFEIKEVRSCVDGFEQVQFCYIEFADGVPSETINIGDPIVTSIECNVDIFAPFKTTCDVGSEPVVYTNSDNTTEMDVSVGANGDIKINSGGGDNSDAEITAFITDCLAAGQEVDLSWSVVGGGSGSATLLPSETTNAFPNFYNDSVNATGATGKVQTMTASHAASEEECALRVRVCPELPLQKNVEVETCDGVETTLVDQEVAVRGVVTVKQCPVIPAPVVEVDVEFVCNAETNVYDQIVTTTTGGVPVVAAPVPTATSCDEDKPDWEVYDMCDLVTSTRHIVTVMFEAGGQTEVSNIDTGVPCVVPTPECVESQEWTYGIDNTGTRFNDVATYEITLSDGTTLNFSQDGTSTSWTPQLQEWATNIQQAADDAGLVWFVEPRFIDNSNPSNIDGTSNGPGGSPSGLPGAPSVVVAEALFAGGMAWRYVNIQICPGQPVPVSARRLTSVQFANNPYELTTAGPVLGPVQKFFVCRECGKAPIWYLDDGVTLASAGQIPNCYEPCGTLSLLPPPPSRECEFFTDAACDNLGQADPAQFKNQVTRRVTYCPGRPPAVEYFETDPTDPTALIGYDLVGQYVDCATGQPVSEPSPTCQSTTYVGLLWKLKPGAVQGTNIDWWAPTQGTFPGGSNAAPHGNVSGIFTSNGSTLDHVNGAPDVSYVSSDFNVPGTSSPAFQSAVGAASNAETSGTDQLRLRGYIILSEPALLRDTNGNTGERGGIWVNICCAGTLDLFQERTTDTVGGDAGVFDGVRLPAGIHYIEAVTSDLSAWQGLQLSVSFDDGATYEPFVSYLTKPSHKCVPVIRCDDSGVLLNAQTGAVITVGEFDLWCEPKGCSGGSSGGSELQSFQRVP